LRGPRPIEVGVAVAVFMALVAVLGPIVTPYDPRAVTGPALVEPSAAHLLGTNDAGQDVLSQLLVGAQVSLVTGLVAAAAAVVIGVLVGAMAGLLGGGFDVSLMRCVDVLLALPALPLMILVAALVGPSRPTTVAVIAFAGWPPIARIVRSRTLTLVRRGFIGAASGFGAGRLYLIRRHVVVALLPLVAAAFVNWSATAITLEAGLAFLGLGDPTAVSWGSMLQRALDQDAIYVTGAWLWWVLPVGSLITLAAMGLAFLGVALEPTANPQWRRV
jgi:ABC-type dipeptide/oligopeptide/nickel transport system permease subunit